ncbi:radical SAM protein [Kitasatospora sp. NPDC004531]
MTTVSFPRFRVTETSTAPRLSLDGADGAERDLPFAPDLLHAAHRLAQGPGEDAGGRPDFREAAFGQLARFALCDEGRLSRFLDYDSLLAPDTPPVRPREVSLIVTKLCNLRCLHCYNDSALRDPNELDESEKVALVDYLGRWGVTILNLTGGEPTIDPVFPTILDLARRYGMGVKISTNAWHVSDALAEAIRNGTVLQLSVSLDGVDAGTHDHLRQRRGSFERVVKSLRMLRDCRPKTLVLNVGIHRGSLAQMDDLARLAAELGVDVLAYKPVTFSGRPGADAPFVLGHAELAEFASARDRLRVEYAGRLVIDGKLTGDEVQPELQEDLHCQAAQTAMVIKADGTMLPCDTLSGVPAAPNFRRTAPMTAWLRDPVFSWFRTLRDSSSGGGCGTSGCPGTAASKQLAAEGGRVAFVPLRSLGTR